MTKVLIINTYINNGGAAIAARRLAEALSYSEQVQVAMLTLHNNSYTDIDKLSFEHQSIVAKGERSIKERANFFLERLQIFLANGFRHDKIFHISTALWGQDISNHPLVKWADIIHLHWICQGMVSLSSLEKLGKMKKRIFWTLHDMWPITAVSPHLSNPNIYESPWNGKEKRLVATVWLKKQSIYKTINPVFIGCSNWITEKAKESYLAKDYKSYSIPNPIDIELFSPQEKLFDNNFYLMFGAVKTSDERKGFSEILDTLKSLKENNCFYKYKIKIIVFGHLSNIAREDLKDYNVEEVGFISSEEKMINLYQRASCLVVPSLYENLPNTIMEAMSCATPCIAYNIGGISEMIDNKVTGLISPSPFDKNRNIPTLAENIIYLANLYQNDRSVYDEMCKKAREKVVLKYSMPVVADKFIELYNKTKL